MSGTYCTASYHYSRSSGSIPSLPVELWDLIFIMALPPAKIGSISTLPSQEHIAVSASQTCRLWRQIALRNSALWATISIQLYTTRDLQKGRDYRMFPRFELVDLWLERSRGRPLTIVVDGSSSELVDAKLLPRLLRELYRWRSVDIEIGDFHSRILAGLNSTLGAPHLETLTLRTDLKLQGPTASFATSLPSAIWRNSPLLREFNLVASVADNTAGVRFTNWAHPAVSDVPYSQLTHLCLGGNPRDREGLTVSDVISILSLSENLVSCIFTSVSNYTDPNTPPLGSIPAIYLDKLQNLSVTANCLLRNNGALPKPEPFSISLLLNYFRMPNLKSLLLTDDDLWEAEGLLMFLEDSKCNLDELVLHVVTEAWEVLDYMVLCPSLTNLCLSETWTRRDSFLGELVEACPTRYDCELRLLCPKLEELALDKNAYNGDIMAGLLLGDILMPSGGCQVWPLKGLTIFDENPWIAEPGRCLTSEMIDFDKRQGLRRKAKLDVLSVSSYTVQWVADFSQLYSRM